MREQDNTSDRLYFIETIFNDFALQLKTVKSQQIYKKDIIEFWQFVNKDILEATVEDAKRYEILLNEKVQKGTLHKSTMIKKLRELSSFYHFIDQHRESYSLPDQFFNIFSALRIDTMQDVIRPSQLVELAELDKLLTYLMHHDSMVLLAVLFSWKMLLRMGEILTLQVSDIVASGDAYGIRLRDDYENVRYNKIPDDILPYLMNYMNQLQPDDHLFIHPTTKKRYTERTLRYRLKEAFVKSNAKPRSFNDIRNTGVVYAVSNQSDVRLVANAMGHKSTTHITRLDSLHVSFNDVCDYISMVGKLKPPN